MSEISERTVSRPGVSAGAYVAWFVFAVLAIVVTFTAIYELKNLPSVPGRS